MITIQVNEFSKRFEISADNLKVVRPFSADNVSPNDIYGLGKLFGDALGKFKGVTGAAVGAAMAYAIIQKLIDDDDKWQDEVSGKLNEIIGKLNQLFVEIRALRELVVSTSVESDLAQYSAQISSHILSVARIMTNIQKNKGMTDDHRKQLERIDESLAIVLGEAASYSRADCPSPCPLRLYPAIQAGFMMYYISNCLLGRTVYADLADQLSIAFTMWQEDLEKLKITYLKGIDAEISFLQNYPKNAPLALANNEPNLILQSNNDLIFLVMVEIEGGLEKPFSVVRIYRGENFNIDRGTMEDFNDQYSLHVKGKDFPFPYQFLSGTAATFITTPSYSKATLAQDMSKMIAMLNERRSFLIAKLDQIDFTQNLIESLESGKVRMKSISS